MASWHIHPHIHRRLGLETSNTVCLVALTQACLRRRSLLRLERLVESVLLARWRALPPGAARSGPGDGAASLRGLGEVRWPPFPCATGTPSGPARADKALRAAAAQRRSQLAGEGGERAGAAGLSSRPAQPRRPWIRKARGSGREPRRAATPKGTDSKADPATGLASTSPSHALTTSTAPGLTQAATRPWRGGGGGGAAAAGRGVGVPRHPPMASSALCCPDRQVLVHVYPGSSKVASEPRVTVPIGRRGRPVQKPRLMPLLSPLSVARKLQAAGIGTVSVL